MNGSNANSAKVFSKKRGLCLAGVCGILVSLAATGCDVVSAAAGVEKADQRSLPCSILCPPPLQPPRPPSFHESFTDLVD